MKELDEKKWEKFDVFGKKGFLRIATTDSSIDSIRLIDGNEKRVPYVTRSEAVNYQKSELKITDCLLMPS